MKVDYKALAKAMEMMLNPCFSPLTMKEMNEFIETKDILVFSMSSLTELNSAYSTIAGNYKTIKHGAVLPNIFSTIEDDDKIILEKFNKRQENIAAENKPAETKIVFKKQDVKTKKKITKEDILNYLEKLNYKKFLFSYYDILTRVLNHYSDYTGTVNGDPEEIREVFLGAIERRHSKNNIVLHWRLNEKCGEGSYVFLYNWYKETYPDIASVFPDKDDLRRIYKRYYKKDQPITFSIEITKIIEKVCDSFENQKILIKRNRNIPKK